MSDDVQTPAVESYKELKERIRVEQAHKTKQQVLEDMKQQSEFVTDLDNLPRSSEHMWVDRGAVVSCEGAGHQPHRHFKR